jgi:hypothetical protein
LNVRFCAICYSRGRTGESSRSLQSKPRRGWRALSRRLSCNCRRRSHAHPIKLEIGPRYLGSVSCSAKGVYLLLTIQRLNCCGATSGVGYAGSRTGYPRARLSPVDCERPPRGRCRSALVDCTARDIGFIFGYLRERIVDAQHPEGCEEDAIKEGTSCIVSGGRSLLNSEKPSLSQPQRGLFAGLVWAGW